MAGRWIGSSRGRARIELCAARPCRKFRPRWRSIGHARIKLGPAASSISGTVLLIGFDRRHVAAVSRGENSGRTLAHVDVVRGIEQVTQFDSRTSTIAAAVRWQCDRVAAIVQARDGAILGVAISDANPL